MPDATSPAARTVAALVHVTCGHVLGVADTHEALQEQADHFRVKGPEWAPTDLHIDDAISRLLAGPCTTCRIERNP